MTLIVREDFKKKVKRVTSSLKVVFEEKNSDMEGRYKNKFCWEIYGFLEKLFLDEVNI